MALWLMLAQVQTTAMPAETVVVLETEALSSSLELERNVLGQVFPGWGNHQGIIFALFFQSSEHTDVMTQ